MPFAMAEDGARLYWRLEGATDRPTVVLLNSIGTDMSLWDAVVPALLRSFRVLRMDARGHGASDATSGDYLLSSLAQDVLSVMDAADVAQAAVAGVSLGGMVAMELALVAQGRITHLLAICTSAEMDVSAWSQRVEAVRVHGMAAVADLVIGRFLSPTFARDRPEIADGLRAGLLAMTPTGYAGSGAAIRDMDLLGRLPNVKTPTLVISGSRDVSTPHAGHGDRIAAAIGGAATVMLESAHLAPIEAPAELAAAIRSFLLGSSRTTDAADVLFAAGLENRRRVLGDEWVDASLARATPFNADFQAMITRTAWQEVWGRPGLDDRTRRLVVLAITCSLGRWEEFGLHVRAGLTRGGFTKDELRELLMQTAVYAGVPAANTGFAEAGRIIGEIEGEFPKRSA